MGRLQRLEYLFERAPIYFVTTCTESRRKILAQADVNEALVKFGEASLDRGAWLGAYVLMPDHLHLFVAIDDERLTLSIWVKSLKNTLSKVLRQTGIPSPHWQKGFCDHVLRSSESYAEKWQYVRENPVRAGLVSRWDQWPFLGQLFPLEFRRDRI